MCDLCVPVLDRCSALSHMQGTCPLHSPPPTCPVTATEAPYSPENVPSGSPHSPPSSAALKTAFEGASPDAPSYTGDHGGKQTLIEADWTQLDPYALEAVAKVVYRGGHKYGRDNWRLIPVTEHLNHALMHIYAEIAGDGQDEHLEHALTRLMFAVAKAKRPDYLGEAATPVSEVEDEQEERWPEQAVASLWLMRRARTLSRDARCNRAECACLIVDAFDNTVLAEGVNGPPGGLSCPKTVEHLRLVHCPEAIHAERTAVDALLRLSRVPRNLHAYVYGHYGPCPSCRERLRAAGVRRIFYTPGPFHGMTFGYDDDLTLDQEAWLVPGASLDGDADAYQLER